MSHVPINIIAHQSPPPPQRISKSSWMTAKRNSAMNVIDTSDETVRAACGALQHDPRPHQPSVDEKRERLHEMIQQLDARLQEDYAGLERLNAWLDEYVARVEQYLDEVIARREQRRFTNRVATAWRKLGTRLRWLVGNPRSRSGCCCSSRTHKTVRPLPRPIATHRLGALHGGQQIRDPRHGHDVTSRVIRFRDHCDRIGGEFNNARCHGCPRPGAAADDHEMEKQDQ